MRLVINSDDDHNYDMMIVPIRVGLEIAGR